MLPSRGCIAAVSYDENVPYDEGWKGQVFTLPLPKQFLAGHLYISSSAGSALGLIVYRYICALHIYIREVRWHSWRACARIF